MSFVFEKLFILLKRNLHLNFKDDLNYPRSAKRVNICLP